ncbi:hypothetical protein DCAR_0209577 [Daucus carota subsp. sativus]|uniref:DC1 domain-containing protein n=1 Tax=Daucus carota subsp. sativus TaxID=79200 RepID=A0AAF0WIL3_DAUCS|nr:hypothetical protein DCAR_0209577 [Daucus carota subsp. sativus]
MNSLQRFSHPKHPLLLKKDDLLGVDAKCYVCNKTVIGSPTYTCTSHDIECQGLYLHKSCAEFPQRINHENHNQHPLTLRPPLSRWLCDVCLGQGNFVYYCELCEFVLCVDCAFEERVLCHEGHEDTLQLMHRKVLFSCDACYEEAKDSSYVCTTCEFWIHKECALAPLIIQTSPNHHHSLHLIYSIPDMHRYFKRFCAICEGVVQKNSWLYYCHKCTFLVHMKCVTRSDSGSTDNIQDPYNESDLVEFPLPNKESLFDLILSQCGSRFQVVAGEGDNTICAPSTLPYEPDIIEEHWSHKNHPLEKLQYFSIRENANSDNGDDERVLICDGCIQPITATYPSYYACIQCGFFLHSFCATQMPLELPAGTSSFHPQHFLLLKKTECFYNLVKCEVCWFRTNGFYYHCEPCDINIDIRCAFLPARIKHKSHKHHSLVQRPIPSWTTPICSLTKYTIYGGVVYECEICSSFQIHILCLF